MTSPVESFRPLRFDGKFKKPYGSLEPSREPVPTGNYNAVAGAHVAWVTQEVPPIAVCSVRRRSVSSWIRAIASDQDLTAYKQSILVALTAEEEKQIRDETVDRQVRIAGRSPLQAIRKILRDTYEPALYLRYMLQRGSVSTFTQEAPSGSWADDWTKVKPAAVEFERIKSRTAKEDNTISDGRIKDTQVPIYMVAILSPILVIVWLIVFGLWTLFQYWSNKQLINPKEIELELLEGNKQDLLVLVDRLINAVTPSRGTYENRAVDPETSPGPPGTTSTGQTTDPSLPETEGSHENAAEAVAGNSVSENSGLSPGSSDSTSTDRTTNHSATETEETPATSQASSTSGSNFNFTDPSTYTSWLSQYHMKCADEDKDNVVKQLKMVKSLVQVAKKVHLRLLNNRWVMYGTTSDTPTKFTSCLLLPNCDATTDLLKSSGVPSSGSPPSEEDFFILRSVVFNLVPWAKKVGPGWYQNYTEDAPRLEFPKKTINSTLFANDEYDDALSGVVPSVLQPLSTTWAAVSAILSVASISDTTVLPTVFAGLALFQSVFLNVFFSFTSRYLFGCSYKSTQLFPVPCKNVASLVWFIFDTYESYLTRHRFVLAAAMEEEDKDLKLDDYSGLTGKVQEASEPAMTVTCVGVPHKVMKSLCVEFEENGKSYYISPLNLNPSEFSVLLERLPESKKAKFHIMQFVKWVFFAYLPLTGRNFFRPMYGVASEIPTRYVSLER